MRPILSATLVVLLAVAAQELRAQDQTPAPAEVRKAIARSLPVIEQASLAWIKKRNCMSCHHVTFMLWSHNEAQANGVAVDAKKLAEWTDWSVQKSHAERAFFKLPSKVVDALPEPLRPKLTELVNVPFVHQQDFLAALGNALPAAELDPHKAALLKQATLARAGTVNDGGSVEAMAQLLQGRGYDGAGSLTPEFQASTADILVRWQEGDGTWKASGQQPTRRWNKPTADQTTTMWTVLALAGLDKPTPAVQKSIDNGIAAIKKGKPDKNHEWLVARMLFERKFGTPEQAALLHKELVGRQNADGGWACMPGEKSEPFSTGQSLYALRLTGMSASDAVVGRGQKFLLATQNVDGSWTTPAAALSAGNTPDRLKKLEPIYAHWGNTWASIGLSRSLSEKE
jgi:squalene-hopene/tetraprenyl-beta-curcumene cyclase